MKSSLEWYIFDLDGTLYDFWWASFSRSRLGMAVKDRYLSIIRHNQFTDPHSIYAEMVDMEAQTGIGGKSTARGFDRIDTLRSAANDLVTDYPEHCDRKLWHSITRIVSVEGEMSFFVSCDSSAENMGKQRSRFYANQALLWSNLHARGLWEYKKRSFFSDTTKNRHQVE